MIRNNTKRFQNGDDDNTSFRNNNNNINESPSNINLSKRFSLIPE
jgi:hypothetical protein